MSWVFFIFLSTYVTCILLLKKGVQSLTFFKEKADRPEIQFSVIIPFRNEERSLPQLLQSFKELSYPSSHYEIFLVDDASTDASVMIITQFIADHPNHNIQLIPNHRHTGSPKKDAIQTAIYQARNNWIVTTDADCIIPSRWLDTLNAFIQKYQPEMVVGPIVIDASKTSDPFLSHFELLDVMSLQGTTMGAFGLGKPLMNNGANLAFTQKGFKEVQGYKGNDHLASGDDHFLLEKFCKWQPDKVCYLKTSQVIITTTSQTSWKALFNQRKRWAAKTSAFKNPLTKLLALIIFLTNFMLITVTIYSIFQMIWKVDLIYYPGLLFSIWAIKMGTDALFFNSINRFFKKRIPLQWQIICGLYYPWFTTTVALASFFGNYTWKGRHFKR